MPFTYEYPHPAVAVDVCLFMHGADNLELLLIERRDEPFKGCWALPGGFVEIDEELETAVARELEEETGITGVELEQLATFGAVGRDPRERVISVAYYGLVGDTRTAPQAGSDAAAAEWFPTSALPELAFDHDEMIRLALQRVRGQIAERSLE